MNPQTNSGIPELVWGPRHPHTKTGIPVLVWGSPKSQIIPKPIWGSPNQNGDQYIPIPKWRSPNLVQSLTRSSLGFVPIWGPTELVPKLERHSKRGPHIGSGIPESVWVGICQNSNLGKPKPIRGSFQFGTNINTKRSRL